MNPYIDLITALDAPLEIGLRFTPDRSPDPLPHVPALNIAVSEINAAVDARETRFLRRRSESRPVERDVGSRREAGLDERGACRQGDRGAEQVAPCERLQDLRAGRAESAVA